MEQMYINCCGVRRHGVTAVILAGGKGSRMGGVNKALLALGHETFLERQLRAASQWADDIVIVSGDRSFAVPEMGAVAVRVVPDVFIGDGPLAGLHAGLAAAANAEAWVLGCDQPFPDAAAGRLLLDELRRRGCHAALPIIGGRLQPLHAVYRKEVCEAAARLLGQGERKLRALLEHVSWCAVDEQLFVDAGISPSFSMDVDTPEQYDQARITGGFA